MSKKIVFEDGSAIKISTEILIPGEMATNAYRSLMEFIETELIEEEGAAGSDLDEIDDLDSEELNDLGDTDLSDFEDEDFEELDTDEDFEDFEDEDFEDFEDDWSDEEPGDQW
jgi:hypothetical protein